MPTINHNPSDRVVSCDLVGVLTADDVATCKSMLDRRLASTEAPFGMVVDVTRLEDVASDAVAPGLQADFTLISNVGRVAVITEKEWQRVILRSAEQLLPRVAIRAFGAAQRTEAARWAAEPMKPGDGRGSDTRTSAPDRGTEARDWIGAAPAPGPAT